ncbi:hypothetical protein C8R44DRAFT_812213 [Mycena epipterygia]|nr:hypothetical protein C8R44DRAFT_812213 [Mycena epipterygia]
MGHGLGTRPDINSTLSRKCVDRIHAYSTICGAAASSFAQASQQPKSLIHHHRVQLADTH